MMAQVCSSTIREADASSQPTGRTGGHSGLLLPKASLKTTKKKEKTFNKKMILIVMHDANA